MTQCGGAGIPRPRNTEANGARDQPYRDPGTRPCSILARLLPALLGRIATHCDVTDGAPAGTGGRTCRKLAPAPVPTAAKARRLGSCNLSETLQLPIGSVGNGDHGRGRIEDRVNHGARAPALPPSSMRSWNVDPGQAGGSHESRERLLSLTVVAVLASLRSSAADAVQRLGVVSMDPASGRAISRESCEFAAASALPRSLTLSVAGAEAYEGPEKVLRFAITLNRAASETVTVAYATLDGTARAGADYRTARGPGFRARRTVEDSGGGGDRRVLRGPRDDTALPAQPVRRRDRNRRGNGHDRKQRPCADDMAGSKPDSRMRVPS